MLSLVRLLVGLGAYGAVLLQVSVLGSWPLLGGQPNLIALGAAVFLVGGRLDLGLIWILVGGSWLDLLLPVRFGSTLLPLLLTFGLLRLLLTRFVESPSWIGTIVVGLLLLVGSEAVVVVQLGAWHQLLVDLVAGTILLMPIAWILMRQLSLRHHGLVVH
ncbi:hypothetical protein HY524_02285 [Candidatus Berkelbacteria bacterium]|nr:hypothetical protein [Candidatus Berkelbacteria bacterium]